MEPTEPIKSGVLTTVEEEACLTEMKVRLRMELQRIIDDIKSLRQGLKSTRSFMKMLQKQQNETNQLEHDLDERLSKQLDKKVKITKEIENCGFNIRNGIHSQQTSIDENVRGVSIVLEGTTAHLSGRNAHRRATRETSADTDFLFEEHLTITGGPTTAGIHRKYRKKIVDPLTCSETVNKSTDTVQELTDVISVRPYLCQTCGSSFAHARTLTTHVQKYCNDWSQFRLHSQAVTDNFLGDDETSKGAELASEGNKLIPAAQKPDQQQSYLYTCPICLIFCSNRKSTITSHVQRKVCKSLSEHSGKAVELSCTAGKTEELRTKMYLYTCPICQTFYSIRKSVIMKHIRNKICQKGLYSEEDSRKVDQQLVVTETIPLVNFDLPSLSRDDRTDKVACGIVLEGVLSINELPRKPSLYLPELRYQCPKCKFCFLFKRCLERHLLDNKCQHKQLEPSNTIIPQLTSKQQANKTVSLQKKSLEKGIVSSQERHSSKSLQREESELATTCFTCGNANVTEWSEHRIKRGGVCLSCDKLFLDLVQIANSSEYEEFKLMSSNRYVCLLCKKSFDSLCGMWRHTRSHTGYRPHVCYKCGHASVTNSVMELHILANHQEDQSSWYICEVCCKTFPTKYGLNGHVKSVHGEKSFQCAFCSAAFTRQDTLTIHMRYHTGERRFACAVCPKRFVRAEDLRLHMPSHSDKKSHQCPSCFKAFKWRSYLKKHMETHL